MPKLIQFIFSLAFSILFSVCAPVLGCDCIGCTESASVSPSSPFMTSETCVNPAYVVVIRDLRVFSSDPVTFYIRDSPTAGTYYTGLSRTSDVTCFNQGLVGSILQTKSFTLEIRCSNFFINCNVRYDYTASCQAPDPCNGVTCSGRGRCSNGVCTCNAGYTGSNCQNTVTDPCAGVTCSGRGTCSNGVCTCNFGYTGSNCQTVDLCAGVSCSGRGTCSGGTCSCTGGYTGTNCQIAPSCGGSTCCSCFCCLGNFCSSTLVGSVAVSDCSSCSSSVCRSSFSSVCPASGTAGVASSSCSSSSGSGSGGSGVSSSPGSGTTQSASSSSSSDLPIIAGAAAGGAVCLAILIYVLHRYCGRSGSVQQSSPVPEVELESAADEVDREKQQKKQRHKSKSPRRG